MRLLLEYVVPHSMVASPHHFSLVYILEWMKKRVVFVNDATWDGGQSQFSIFPLSVRARRYRSLWRKVTSGSQKHSWSALSLQRDNKGCFVTWGGEQQNTETMPNLLLWCVIVRGVHKRGMSLMPRQLDDVDFIFTNNDVATEDTTIAKLIESSSEGTAVDCTSNIDSNYGGCTPQPKT